MGFIFDSNLKRVLLAHKEKPAWQKGKLNGVGGKYEPGETAEECIRRETLEETSLDIPEWTYVGEIQQEAGNVGFLAAVYKGNPRAAKKADYEEVEWFDIDALPSNIIPNLRWLIPISLEKVTGNLQSFMVRY